MNKTVFIFFSILSGFSLYAQSLTAKQVKDAAVSQKSAQESLEYVQSKLPEIQDKSERRAIYSFLGSLQEDLSMYKEAAASYAAAAGIAGSDAAGMPKKSNQQLVIDAVRCSLNSGDWETADGYLNSSVRNSKSSSIQAYIKLYEQWSALCRCEKLEETEESAAMLKAYLELPSMKEVKSSVLFTLWYLTADSKYALMLNKEFPKSPETGIVNGKVQLLPSPFWFFVPHKENASINFVSAAYENNQSTTAEKSAGQPQIKETSLTEETVKAKKYQLGLFRKKENAQGFSDTLKQGGFNACVEEETRSSGTKYFLVIIDENADGTVADKLRTAGYECYPVF